MARATRGRSSKAHKARFRWALEPRERVLLGAALLLLCLYALTLLEAHVWLGALLSELRAHLALLGLALGSAALLRRSWAAAALALVTGALLVLPQIRLHRPTSPTPEHGPTLTLAHAHLHGEPLDERGLFAWLERASFPSVVALTGLRAEDASALAHGVTSYRGRAHAGTQLLFVHERVEKTRFGVSDTDLLFATLRVGRCDVRTFVLDLPSRFDFRALKARSERIKELTRASTAPRSVWLGHLGSSVEASDLEPFLRARELRDSRRGHGRLATAPASLSLLGVPLDHALVHGWIGVRARSVGEGASARGHRAVHVTIELTEPRCHP